MEGLTESVYRVIITKLASQGISLLRHLSSVLLMVCMITACSKDYTESEYLQMALNHYQNREFSKSVIDAKNTLQKNNENIEARLLLTRIYYEFGDFSAADSEIRKIPAASGFTNQVVPLKAKVLQSVGRVREVVTLPEFGLTDTALASLLTSKALAHMQTNQLLLASEYIEKALTVGPASAYTLTARAQLLTMQQNHEEARRQLSIALEQDPKYNPAYSLLGHIEHSLGNLDAAVEAYSKAVENNTNYYSDLLKLAQIKISRKDFDSAYKDAQKLIRRFPNNTGVNYTLGLAEYYRGNYQEAINAFEKADAELEPSIQFYQGHAHLYLGNLQQATQFAESFHQNRSEFVPGIRLLSEAYLLAGKLSAAENLLRPVVASDPDDLSSLNLLIESLWRQGELEKTTKLFERLLTLEPNSEETQFRMALLHINKGEHRTAIDSLESLLQKNPEDQKINSLLVKQYLEINELEKSTKAATNFLNVTPDSDLPHMLLGEIYMAKGDHEKSRTSFQEAFRINPGNIAAALALIDIAVLNRDFQQARSICKQSQRHNEQNLSILLTLANIENLDGKTDKMIEALEQAVESHPNALRPRLLLARHFLTHGSPAKVQTVLDQHLVTVSGSAEALELLGEAQLKERQYKSAVATLNHSIQLDPTSDSAHLLQSRAYAGMNNLEAAENSLLKVISLSPDHLQANAGLAKIYFVTNKHDEFIERLNVLRIENANHLETLRLEASWYKRRGRERDAISTLEAAYDKFPRSDTLLELTEYQLALGQLPSAQKNLENWVEHHPRDTSARSVLASVYNKRGLPGEANKQYHAILKIEPDNPIVLNNLAWNLRESDPEQALQHIEVARKKSPSIRIMDTYALILAKLGNTTTARNILKRIINEDDQPNPTLLYHKALIDHQAKDNASAIRTLRRVLELNNEFEGRADAEALLNYLLEN